MNIEDLQKEAESLMEQQAMLESKIEHLEGLDDAMKLANKIIDVELQHDVPALTDRVNTLENVLRVTVTNAAKFDGLELTAPIGEGR